MRDSTNSQPLSVLIVADDRPILRHLSRFLNTFSYDVQEVVDRQQALGLLESDPPDMLIVDSSPSVRDALKFCRAVSGRDNPNCVHTLLMIGREDETDLTEALEAGVDDFLAKPLVYGELLVRLRAGARTLEFERRLREQASAEPLTGLPGSTAFHDQLTTVASMAADGERTTSCVLVDIDFLGQINRTHGQPGGDVVIAAVAEKFRELATESMFLASFSGGRFCLILPSTSDDEAAQWADRMRAVVADTEFALADSTLHLTVSLGIASHIGASSQVEKVVQRAGEALKLAKNSGRNCAVRFGQFNDEIEVWKELAAPGRFFEQTVARDVMTPAPIVLERDHTVAQAASLFRQTRLDVVAVVDKRGKLAGVLLPQDIQPHVPGDTPVSEVMSTDASSYEEQTEFSTLMEFFAAAEGSLAVIVSEEKPTGFVTPAALASLSEPLQKNTFAPGLPLRTTEYLLVPEPDLDTEPIETT
jgi:diguanylate cyclase (GGDEF)-like protein